MSKIDVAYHQSSCFGRICTDNNSSGVYYHSREDEKNKSDHHLDEVLAQAMKHLSFDELQREQEELHGVAVGISEEHEAVEGLLMALENHLNRLKQGTKFETAQLMDSVYVSRKEFRLMFLRGNRYDPKAAAEQLIRHFDTKSQLFGLNKLTKDITLADLDADDIHSLNTGSFQVSKWTDRSNRTILLELPGLRSYKSLINELRARFYLLMNMATYMEDLTKGLCFISYCVDQYKDPYNGSGFVEHTKMGLSIPCNIGGMHLCISDHTEAIITKAAIAIMPARLRAKTKVHFGSHTECQYQLSTFGISRVALPFSFENNDICLDDHMAWYHQRLRAESNHTPANSLSDPSPLEPTDNDVVFNGRTSNNQANERLRMLTLDYASAYDSNNVEDKRRIVTSMIEDIQSNGGRFLKFSNETEEWNEVPLVEVREKGKESSALKVRCGMRVSSSVNFFSF